MLRGIMYAAPHLTYIVVPPDLVSELMGPSFIPALVKARRGVEGSIVLILEDADSCLIRRGADNMSGIAGLLNFSDGIIGSVLDVRIVATTNAKKLDIDDALRRPGRLSIEMEIEPLEAVDANKLINKLAPDAPPFTTKTELSKIYQLARKHGWKPPPPVKKHSGRSDDDDYYD